MNESKIGQSFSINIPQKLTVRYAVISCDTNYEEIEECRDNKTYEDAEKWIQRFGVDMVDTIYFRIEKRYYL